MGKRLSLDEYFLKMAILSAQRSTCLRRQVGAIAVKDKHVLATGYNGAPAGLKHCEEVGCIRQQRNIPSGQQHELCRAVHAEQNLIIQACLHGNSLKGSTVYCTHSPCSICAKLLINCQVERIVYLDNYFDELAFSLLNESGIILNHKESLNG